MTTQDSSDTTFSEGEKVLCFHLGYLYEAKILKLDTSRGFGPKQVQYFVHYNGWKKTWDEWVPEGKLLKINDTNRQKQKELRDKGSSPAGAGPSGPAGPAGPLDASPAVSMNMSTSKSTRRVKAQDSRLPPDDTPPTDLSLPPPPIPPQPRNHAKSSASTAASPLSNVIRSTSSTASAQKENNNNNSDKKGSSQSGSGGSKKQTLAKRSHETGPNHPNMKTPLSPIIVGGTSTRPIISGGGQRGRPQKLADEGKEPITKRQRIELPIKIPETLKKILVEDWDLVSRQMHLAVIPASVSVENILCDYIGNREALPDPCIRTEFVASLKEYFNIMLGPQLLYRFERNQFNTLEDQHIQINQQADKQVADLRETYLVASHVYGAVHLLRLFVKLGAVLSYTPLSQEESRMLLDVTHDFLSFLLEEQSYYFNLKPLFKLAPEDYVDKFSSSPSGTNDE